jgi:hypothetical protein
MPDISMREIIQRLDSPVEPFYGDDSLCEECGVDSILASLSDHGFTRRPIWRWLCTDTVVGLFAVYWHGEFVCVSWQSARKNHTQYQWASEDSFYRVKSLLEKLWREEQDKPRIDLLNWDELIPIHHTLEFSAQISDHSVVYRGQPARVNKQFRTNEPNTWHLVQLEIDGRLETVDVREVCIPVSLKPQEG